MVHRYHVWRADETRDGHATFDALDHEHAAEEWAQQSDLDSAEYSIVAGRDEPIVCVALATDKADIRRFRVRGEAVPSYSATEVQP